MNDAEQQNQPDPDNGPGCDPEAIAKRLGEKSRLDDLQREAEGAERERRDRLNDAVYFAETARLDLESEERRRIKAIQLMKLGDCIVECGLNRFLDSVKPETDEEAYAVSIILAACGETEAELATKLRLTANWSPQSQIQFCSALEWVVGRLRRLANPLPVVPEPEAEPAENGLNAKHEAAFQSFILAETTAGKPLTDKEAFHWLTENAPADYELPPTFQTWQRYVRKGRNFHNAQKNTPRAGRTGRSIATTDDVQVRRESDNA